MAEGRRLGPRHRRHVRRLRLSPRRRPELAADPASIQPHVLMCFSWCSAKPLGERSPAAARLKPSRYVVVMVLGLAWTSAPASALEVEVRAVRTPAGAVSATIELRDMIPERFKKT